MRYPLAPLAEALGLSEHALCVRLRITGLSMKYRRDGVSERVADRLAVRAGLLPWLVWDDWLSDLERVCEARGCDNRFVPHPKGPHRRFCCNGCRRREGERRARELGLPSAVRKREQRRRYYAENGDYERARQRAYDRARRAA